MSALSSLMYAVRMVESGGRYGVVNSIGATGAYQVMPANIGPWTERWFGHRLTQSQFLHSKAAQDAVARGQLGEYLRRYGARGAAQAWNGGPGAVGKDYTSGYANKVMGYFKGGGGGHNSHETYDDYDAPRHNVHLSMHELAEQYGFAAGFFKNSHELEHLIKQATHGQWSTAKFTAELHGTKWFRKHSSTEREWIALQTGDPATAHQRIRDMVDQIQQLAGQLGVKMSGSEMRNLALKANEFGFSGDRLRYAVASHFVWNRKSGLSGDAAKIGDQVKQTLGDYGLDMSDKRVAGHVGRILAGHDTIDSVVEQARNNAKSLFPSAAKAIDQGATLRDVAQPYVDTMANMLELDPGTVNIGSDHHVRQALLNRDQDGEVQDHPMALFQFEDRLRNDPRWARTDQANNQTMDLATGLLQAMGLM